MSNIRVAVIGAGIGGLTFCIALGQQPNSNVEIYEAAQEFGEVGAGIGMWYRTQQIMDKLGLHSDLKALAGGDKKGADGTKDSAEVALHFRKSDQPEGLGFHILKSSGELWVLHRANFQKTIISHLPPSCAVHFGKRLVSYDDPASGPITLRFKDGTTAECDVLVGADGIKSAVRDIMFSNLAKEAKLAEGETKATHPNIIWSGTVAYRALIPKERLEAKAPGHRALIQDVVYCGKNKHLMILPVNNGAQINVVAMCSDFSKEGTRYSEHTKDWAVVVPKEELLQQYEHWEPELMALLECIDAPTKWAIHMLVPLSTFVSGRVAILGDSAHAMAPHTGSGAGQAIEDAYILAALLGSPKCTPVSLPRVLQIYDAVRRPAANDVWRLSRANGMTYEFASAGFEHVGVRDEGVSRETLAQMAAEAEGNYDWAWKTSAEPDREKALAMLSEL